nr:hypothetical protein [Tanacetum cinerariifolium]
MSPKDIVFTTKPFEYEAFVTSISDSRTVPSFEELRTKVLNQESRLHRIHPAQHSEQQSAFVSQTLAASDNRSSRSNYNGARNNSSLLYDNSKSSTVKERNERARARERLDGMNGLSLRALSQ